MPAGNPHRTGKNQRAPTPSATGTPFVYPPDESAGYLIRQAHRAFQRALERRISPRGIPRGQWYFLRVLWENEGLTQRELSARIGIMEPTTIVALRNMEKAGLVTRRRDGRDRRKILVYLTARGRALRDELLPLAKEVNAVSSAGISREELAVLRRVLARMARNLEADAE